MRRIFAASFLLLFFASAVHADMAGTYVARKLDDGGVKLKLSLEDGHVSGDLRLGNGKAYKLNGEWLGGSAQGALKRDDNVLAFFYAEQSRDGVNLQFIPKNSAGKPDILQARLYDLIRGDASFENIAPAQKGASKSPELRPSVAAGDEKSLGKQKLPMSPVRH